MNEILYLKSRISTLSFENEIMNFILNDLLKNKKVSNDDLIILYQKYRLELERSGYK